MIGLVILAHGSRLPEYKETVEMHKKRIENLGVFDEVATAYIVEKPSLSDVISKMRSEKILVVPLFISKGEHLKEIESVLKDERAILCDPIGESELVTFAIVLSALKRIKVLSFE